MVPLSSVVSSISAADGGGDFGNGAPSFAWPKQTQREQTQREMFFSSLDQAPAPREDPPTHGNSKANDDYDYPELYDRGRAAFRRGKPDNAYPAPSSEDRGQRSELRTRQKDPAAAPDRGGLSSDDDLNALLKASLMNHPPLDSASEKSLPLVLRDILWAPHCRRRKIS